MLNILYYIHITYYMLHLIVCVCVCMCVCVCAVVEVRFADQFPFVVEGQGVLPVTLVKSDDAIGPVRVRLFTQDDTALGKPLY